MRERGFSRGRTQNGPTRVRSGACASPNARSDARLFATGMYLASPEHIMISKGDRIEQDVAGKAA